MRWLVWCPIRFSSSASCRTLLHVQRSGDSGSPRSVGSTNLSRSLTSVASFSTVRLRPPPGFRIRPAADLSRSFNSCAPTRIARRDTPVALETIEAPPRPIASASAAATQRRSFSFSIPSSSLNRLPIVSTSAIPHKIHPDPQLCNSYFVTIPYLRRKLPTRPGTLHQLGMAPGDPRDGGPYPLPFRLHPLVWGNQPPLDRGVAARGAVGRDRGMVQGGRGPLSEHRFHRRGERAAARSARRRRRRRLHPGAGRFRGDGMGLGDQPPGGSPSTSPPAASPSKATPRSAPSCSLRRASSASPAPSPARRSAIASPSTAEAG